mmetsp:Transcript_7683/g.25242  ORF Transcript_7683/g.25242 Transcript_7683/m.25242 type:complete len:94 (+) Transcript_7683:106-387(+)
MGLDGLRRPPTDRTWRRPASAPAREAALRQRVGPGKVRSIAPTSDVPLLAGFRYANGTRLRRESGEARLGSLSPGFLSPEDDDGTSSLVARRW